MAAGPPPGAVAVDAAAALGLNIKLIPFLSGSRSLVWSLKLRSTSLNGSPSGQET